MKLYLLCLFIVLAGCTESKLFLANSFASVGSYTLHRDLKYGDDKDQRIDIYTPLQENISEDTRRPVIIFFYGGCWGACSDLGKSDYRFLAKTLVENGNVVVVVDYRKYPNVLFPGIMTDATHSVEWVNQHIESYGGSKDNIFLMGHSSGAHIASMLNFNEQYLSQDTKQSIKGFIGLAGPYDFLPFDEPYQPTLFAPPESFEKSQTINYVDGGEAPSLLLYGKNDTRVKPHNIVSLENKIKINNGKVKALYYDGIDHIGIVAALSILSREGKSVLKDILMFIDEYS